jgi:hypothetical protein
MAGLKDYYTLTSTSSGSIFGSLTANVLASGTIAAGSTVALTLAYAKATTTALPACAGATTGATTVGNSVTYKTVAAVAFSFAATIQFVITGLTPGQTYWFELETTNTGTGFTSTVSNPMLAIIDLQANGPPNDNMIFLKGGAPSCTISAATAVMGGMAVLPTTASQPMEYQTTSYGSGVVQITFATQLTTTAVADTYQWQFAYGQVTDGTANPACAATGTGTTVGNLYEFKNTEAIITDNQQTVTVTIVLSHATEYWFDLQCTNSAASVGTESLPQMQITEAA